MSTGWAGAGRAEGSFQPRPFQRAKDHPEGSKFRCQVQRARGGLEVGEDPGGSGMEWEQAGPETSGPERQRRTPEVPAVKVRVA